MYQPKTPVRGHCFYRLNPRIDGFVRNLGVFWANASHSPALVGMRSRARRRRLSDSDIRCSASDRRWFPATSGDSTFTEGATMDTVPHVAKRRARTDRCAQWRAFHFSARFRARVFLDARLTGSQSLKRSHDYSDEPSRSGVSLPL